MGTIRKLRADEIEVRVSEIKQPYKEGENGTAMLLLYKTARVDMDILDEVFGAENWSDKYERIGEQLFCTITVYIDGRNVAKTDCGIESQQTDDNKYKAEASDAFKRAGFKWGIGRELYTAPRIGISVPVKRTKTAAGKEKWTMAEPWKKYRVWEIGYNESGKISLLKIADEKNAIVFSYPKDGAVAKTEKKAEPKAEPKVENADFVEVTANGEEKPQEEYRKGFCADCDENISPAVYNYSLKRYGRPLCMKCQKAESLPKVEVRAEDCPF
jgi:hypothetical protein|nr:MAG TPA: hypothetical protein [Caudoviricetes sp.]